MEQTLDEQILVDALAVDLRPPQQAIDHALTTAQWERLLDTARRTRLLGFVRRAVETGGIPVTDTQSQQLAAEYAARRHRHDSSFDITLRVGSAFDDRGIPWCALKGLALSHSVYGHGERDFADVDLLVHPDDLDRALDALHDMGASRFGPARHRTLEREFVTAVPHSVNRFAIDLHRLAVRPPLGDLLGAAFFERRTSGDLPTLDLGAMAVHAGLTLLVGDVTPAPIRYRDVVEAATAAGHDRVQRTAQQLGVSGLTASAIDSAAEFLGVSSPVGPFEDDTTWQQVLALHSARWDSRLPKDAARAFLLGGSRASFRYLRYLVGSREYREFRGGVVRRWRRSRDQ